MDFVTAIYLSVDKAIKDELKRLYIEDGIVPSCKKGCFRCCSQHIITNTVEVKALAYYIRHYFTSGQIEDLKLRTIQWYRWDNARRGKINSARGKKHPIFAKNKYCPMLVNGICSVYELRPLICRRFFVNSSPLACLLNPLMGTFKHDSKVLASVISVTTAFEVLIKNYIENLNMDYQKSIALLPHKLADEMNWEIGSE